MICPGCRAPNDETALACSACGQALMPHTLGTLKPGALVAARYEVLQFVGKGGMGVVIKARDRALDEIVALKVLRADLAESAEMDRRFRTEIKLARRVRHRNVCAIHEYGEDGPLRYISMEFIEGTDLRQIVRETGGPLPHEGYEIAEQASLGLQAIHEAGIIHRDLKTSNIMRDSKGFVRLMDFGIAKDSSGETAGATGTGQLIGTPEYMSPEQIRGDKIDFRSDIYSLGIVIFEVFTSRVPFQADTPIATILKHLQEPPPLEGPEAVRLPRELIPVLARALAKDRAARQSTVAELLEDLRQARSSSFPEAATPRGTAVTRPSARRAPQTASSRVTEVPALSPTLPAAQPTVARPATRRAPVAPRAVAARRDPAPTPAAPSAVPWAAWVAAPILTLAVAGGAFVAVRTWGSQPSSAATAAPVPPGSQLPPVTAPPPSAPPVTAAAAPPSLVRPSNVPRPPSTASGAPARPAGPSASELAALERAAGTDPEGALAQATALAGRYPDDAGLRQRLGQYRADVAKRLFSRGREALVRAEAALSLDGYLEANRLFSKALDADPGSKEARDGLAQAIRGEERVRSRLTQVSFEQTGTDVSGTPSTDLPPGLAAPPSGVVIKRAQPAGPRARLAIEIEPRMVKPGEEYVVRYFLQNESNGPLLIAGASIQNQIGESGVTGGRVEPATATVPPRGRSLLFEARDVWRHELGTAWRTTLRVFLTDGTAFSSSLTTRR